MATQFAMLVDANKCINCKGCEAACKLENMVYDEIKVSYQTPKYWQRCSVEQIGPVKSTGNTKGNYIVNFFMPCMQCEKPACIASCPVPGKALYKDEATGIVLTKSEECVGCGLCTIACPYAAVRLSDRFNSKGKRTVDKCTYCYHRVADNVNKPKEEWLKPACVTKCPSGALDFGLKEDIIEGLDLMNIDKPFEINPSTSYVKAESFSGNNVHKLLTKRRKTTSADLTDIEFDPRAGAFAHGKKEQNGPYLYKNKDFNKDAWSIDDFAWEEFHGRSGVRIEKGDYKWL